MGFVLIQHPDEQTRGRIRELLEADGHWTVTARAGIETQTRILTHAPDVALITPSDGLASTGKWIELLKGMSVAKRLGVALLWSEANAADPAEALALARADALVNVADLSAADVCNAVRSILESPPDRPGARRFLRYGHLELDRDTRSARLGGAFAVDIPEKHFALLWFLARRATESRDLCPRETILSRLWQNKVRDREVDVTISRLKSRLPFLAPYIESVPRKGYRLRLPALVPRKALTPKTSR